MIHERDRRQRILATLRQLSEAASVPGHEDPVRHIFQNAWQDVGPMEGDRLGSVLCTSAGSSDTPRVLLDAHMDEVGFLVQSIDENGFLRIVPVGGWWSHVLPAQRVQVGTRSGSIPGTISIPSPHLLPKEARTKLVDVRKLCVDVGAENREQAEGEFGIRIGDAITPHSPFVPLAHPDRFSGKAFDNRVGCTVLLHALLEVGSDHPNRLIGSATVQEEVGCRGAQTIAEVAHPDVAIVLEGCPADDTPGIADRGGQGRLGHGVQIRLFDPSMITHPILADLAIQTAKEEKISHQISVNPTGGTNGKFIHVHGVGVPTIVLGVPVRSIHSHVGVLDLRDLLSTLDLLLALVGRLDETTVTSIHERVVPT